VKSELTVDKVEKRNENANSPHRRRYFCVRSNR